MAALAAMVAAACSSGAVETTGATPETSAAATPTPEDEFVLEVDLGLPTATPTEEPVDETVPWRPISSEGVARWDTVQALVEAWNAQSEFVAGLGLDPVAIDLAEGLANDSELEGLDSFIVPLNDGIFLGGTTDEASGAVTGLMLMLDPDNPDRRGALTTLSVILEVPEPLEPLLGVSQLPTGTEVNPPVDYTETVAGGVWVEVIQGVENDDPIVALTVSSSEVPPDFAAQVHGAIRLAATEAFLRA